MFARSVLALLAASAAHAASFSQPALAQTAKPVQQTTPAAAAPATAPAPAAAPKPAAATPAPALSESKFLSALYSAIARRTPPASPAGDGEVTASFHVNAQGKIDKVTIDKTTSPALAEAVKKILSSVEAPPPPGGSMDIGQTFKFRADSGR